MSDVISLSRDVEAIQIPAGTLTTLPKDSAVIITQSLGGTYTVVVQGQSGLFRIQGKDADVLGKPIETGPVVTGPFDEKQIWDQLKTCYDPEIPVNIVDLGLIYSLEVEEAPNGGKKVIAKMTLTAPGCGMGPAIAADAQQKILTVPGVTDAQVDVVWDPPWSPERISPEGKEKLGMV